MFGCIIRRCAVLATLSLAASLTAMPSHALDPSKRFSDYARDNWGARNGLPQISVLSITQDRDGFIWVGTQNGIARFDGVRFRVFNRANTGLPLSFVRAAFTDRDGRVWFGTDRALLRFNGRGFDVFETPDAPVAVRALAQTAAGVLVASTPRGLFHLQDGALTPWQVDPQARELETGALLRDGETLWAGVQGGVLGIAGDTIRSHGFADRSDRLVTGIARDASGLLLGTDHGLKRLVDAVAEPAFPGTPLAEVEITMLFADRDGSLWIGTGNALYRHNALRGLERLDEREFIASPWIISAFEDRDGNVWLGSQSESLFRLWNGWVRRLGVRDGFDNPLSWSLVRAADGRIIVGTNASVLALDGMTAKPLIAAAELPNPAAYHLFLDSTERLWIGTRAGIARYESGRVVAPASQKLIGPLQINDTIQTGAGVWIGTQGGLFLDHGDRAEAVGERGTAPRHRVRALHALGDSHLLVGTEAGLYELRDEALGVPAWSADMAGRFVTAIAPLRDELLVITTFDEGIALTDQSRLVRITDRHGLNSSNAWTVKSVGEHVYFSSLDGAYRVPRADLEAFWVGGSARVRSEVVIGFEGQRFGGLRTRCCNGGAPSSRALVDDGGIWYPMAEGIVHLDVAAIHAGSVAPRVLIESMRHADVVWSAGDPIPAPFAGAMREVEIVFTGIDHRDPTGLRFQYRLDGFDREWREAGDSRRAFYTNLPPGKFTFRVRAASSSGIASQDDASVAFEIAPRWHERRSVQAAIAALAALLSWLALRLRIARYRNRQQLLETIVTERTAELALANSRLRESNQMLVAENRVDANTGLLNRRHALKEIEALAGRWHAPGQPAERCLALVLINVDYMKRLNERYGTTAADGILQQFAQELQRLAGPESLVAHWGGDEFLVVLDDVARAQMPERAARLRRLLVEKLYAGPDGRDVVMPCSVGYACYPLRPEFGDQVPWIVSVELADAAVQQVKLQGRNSWAGVEVSPGTEAITLRYGAAGRTLQLTRNGVLEWRNFKPRST
jgi:diguanylate cyclase (GGDEF)-like protein